jgi:hypothetical protein
VSEKSDLRDRTVAQTAAPERAVVKDPPPRPDYPRYRVEPGERVSLAEIDPGETEHYRRKKDVKKKLEGQRRGIRDLQGRLYAENRRGCSSCSRLWTPAARTARSSMSSRA